MFGPMHFAETPEGLLLMADGLSPMLKWDGLASAPLVCGVRPPSTAPTLAASDLGEITGDYYAYVRFVNSQGAYSNLSPISAGITAAQNGTITYTNVSVPTQADVVGRQILRNTAGQASVFYVDVDTDDIVSTSFTSTKDDTALNSCEPAPLFDDQGNVLVNVRGMPPAHKSVLCHHLGRMFAAVDGIYSEGSVILTNGSTLVTGVNTNWTTAMVGRFLYAAGATAKYEIASVDASAQTLTLTTAYTSPSDSLAHYAIRPAPAERRLVYYTEAGQPESWPPWYAISIQEDGDEITGLMAKGSFLFIIEERHIYRFTCQSDPAVDGFVFLTATRGCVNQRSWVVVEDTAYMLDYAGVHGFGGGQEVEPTSDMIQRVFRPDGDHPRINWLAKDQFHCALSPDEQIVRWFVCLSGEYLPRHALCLEHRAKRWWLEEYDRPVASSQTGTYEGRRRVYLGGDGNQTYLYSGRTLDGVDPTGGQTSGWVSSAAPCRLTSAGQQWPANLVGRSVTITRGRGRGQRRQIIGVEGDTLLLLTPWLVQPDGTSAYQLGGIGWEWRSGWFRWVADEESTPRRLEVVWDPTKSPAPMVVQVYRDFERNGLIWQKNQSATEAEGMGSTKGSPDLIVDLSDPVGFAQQRLDARKELHLRGPRFVSVGLQGVSASDPQTITQVSIDSAKQ